MNTKILLLLPLFFGLIAKAHANDSVVEIGAGGLIFSEEKNISMVKESLYIAENEVSVQYEFLNESKNDIEVMVGFPIPPFGIDSPSNTQKYPPVFGDFEVLANGSPVKYDTEVKAVTEHGEDITGLLKSKKIDYAKFGGFDIFPLADGEIDSPAKLPNYDVNKLSNEDKKLLIFKGALSEDQRPLWLNKTTYYWKQKFPSGQITKISHTYTPYTGGAFSYDAEGLESAGSACIEPTLHEKFSKHVASNTLSAMDRRIDFAWVRYILTTANSWKMPIKNFELTLSKQPYNADTFISLCWDGNLRKISDTEFRSTISNFKPEKDLLIYWYHPK